MHVFDANGAALASRLSVEPYEGIQTVVLEAAWGSAARDYPRALVLLLGRLQRVDALITDAIVDSRVTRELPTRADRRLVLRHGRTYPIRLRAVDDLDELRLAIGAAQEHVGQQPRAKGGNRNKRIRIMVAPGAEVLPTDLEGFLSSGSAAVPEIENALDASAVAAGKRPRTQGFRQSAEARRAIEVRAMDVAKRRLAAHGCVNILDVSSTESYDLNALYEAQSFTWRSRVRLRLATGSCSHEMRSRTRATGIRTMRSLSYPESRCTPHTGEASRAADTSD